MKQFKLLFLFLFTLTMGVNSFAQTLCAKPDGVTASITPNNLPTTATISWGMTPYSLGTVFLVEYKPTGSATWLVQTALGSPFTLTGLTPCTDYTVRVTAQCPNIGNSLVSLEKTFTTSCPNLTCNAPTLTISTAPVLGTVTHNITAAWTNLAYPIGTTYTVEYKLNTATTWTTATATTTVYTITGLAACSEYQVRVKVNCSATSSSAYSNQTAILTGGCPAPCTIPSFQASADTSSTKGKVYVGSTNGTGTTYTIEYKTSSAANWTVATTTAPSGFTVISGLTPCTEYQVRVKANCASGTMSAYSTTSTFKTIGCPPPCTAPILSATSTGISAVLNWSTLGYPTGTSYTVQYKKNTATTWINLTATTSPFTINALDSCSEYQFKVKANCSSAVSSALSNQAAILTVCPILCNAPIATAVAGANIPGTVGYSGLVSWVSANYPVGTFYVIQYKKNTATTWTTTSTTISPYQIVGLDACTEYQVKVQANCSNTTASAFSTQVAFTTGGCTLPCAAPGVQATADTSATKGKVYVNSNNGTGTTYTVEYKLPSAANWTVATTTATGGSSFYLLTGLTTCTEYMVRAKANCSNGAMSVYSNTSTFKTVGCAPPVVCLAPVVAATPDTVSTKGKVVFSTVGYPTGTTFTLEYKLPSATTWTTASTTATSPYSLTGLTVCTEYQVRAKANCSATSASNYSVVVAFKTIGCPVPANCEKPYLQAYVNPTLSSFSGTIAWNTVIYPTGTVFIVEYKLVSATAWTVATTNATTSPYTISTLQPCSEYQIRIKAVCSATSMSAYSNTATFKTVGCVPCPKPAVISTTGITASGALISWSGTGAASYTIQYKLALSTSAAWTTVTSTTNSVLLTGLSNCKYYIVKVQANCANNSTSGYTNTQTFKTLGCPLTTNKTTEALVVSPNPTSSVLNVSYVLEQEGKVVIDLVNAQGQIVRNLVTENMTSGYYQNVSSDISDLSAGMYFVVMKNSTGETQVERLIKQ